MNVNIISSILLIAISFNAVINDIIMKTLLIGGFSPFAVNGLRIFFSCLMAMVIGYNTQGIKIFDGWYGKDHMIRNITTIIALLMVIYGLKYCQIAQVDLITYLIPAVISLISTIFFQESFNKINFILVIICVITFVLRKGLFNTLPLIISATLFGFAEVWIKHKMHKYNLWNMIVSLGITGSLLLSYWWIPALKLLSPFQWLLSIMMGMGDIGILSLITWKSKIGSSHDFLPLRYTSIIFAVLADKFVFNILNIDYIMIGIIILTSLASIFFNYKNIR